MNDFLPKGYATPESERRFMELTEGANTFRVLSPAIVGYEWWEDTGNGDRVPRRVRTAEEVPAEVRNAPEDRDAAKHFWALTVYNYDTQSIQVLELKQKSIMRAIEAYMKNPKWGNPMGYDLLIEKVKTGVPGASAGKCTVRGDARLAYRTFYCKNRGLELLPSLS
jgi:hypothetical protein